MRKERDFSDAACQPFLLEGGDHGVLLLHGFTGSAAHMRPLGEAMNRHGFTVMGVNLPGHAVSMDDMARTGWQDWLDAAKDAFLQLQSRCRYASVAGLSMGGYGAVVNGLRHPETFGVIAGMSSAFIKENILSAAEERGKGLFNRSEYAAMFGLKDVKDFEGSENDYDLLARRVTHNRPKIYLCCGEEDGLLGANLRFRDLLLELGYELTWEQWSGNHNWLFWDEAIEKIIRWLPLGKGEKGESSENVPVPKT